MEADLSLSKIDFPDFHDGYLTSIEVVDRGAIIGLRHFNHKKYRLCLRQVEALIMNDFREGNIIFNLDVITGTAPDLSDLRQLWPTPHPSVSLEYQQKDFAFIERHFRRIGNGEETLISVTPSYGCDLLAVCASIELLELDEST